MSVKLKKCSSEENDAIIGLYHLIARLLAEELNAEVVEVLLKPEVLSSFSKADLDVEAYLKDIDYENAAADFCHLFILPGKQNVSPRAVAWLGEGNEVSADGVHAVVEAFIANAKIALPDPYKSLTYDHAAVLFFLAARLRETGFPQAGEFEEAVLGSWVARFGKRLARSTVPIYQAVGQLIVAA